MNFEEDLVLELDWGTPVVDRVSRCVSRDSVLYRTMLTLPWTNIISRPRGAPLQLRAPGRYLLGLL